MTWQLQRFLIESRGWARPITLGGKWLTFQPNGRMICGYTSYEVVSNRGRFVMGIVEFSNQWGAYSFVAYQGETIRLHGEGLAEIYAFLKSLKPITGRFV